MAKIIFCVLVGVSLLVLGMQTAQPAQPQQHVVKIVNYAFQPQALTVHVGEAVTFENDDYVTHNVTADAFKSGDIAGGKTWSYTFVKAGVFTYVCTYHPGMQGTITVATPAP